MSAPDIAVRERPILFSGEMVRAILDGRKTQTRRVVTGRVALEWLAPGMFIPEYVALRENGLSPYGYAGDRLWVRETWTVNDYGYSMPPALYNATVAYRADGTEISYECPQDFCDAESERDAAGANPDRWRPSIHMPRWASRITLELTDVRVQRVQDITGEDVEAEGVEFPEAEDYTRVAERWDPFIALWDSINAKRGYGWDANPWVWALSFQKVTP